MDKIISRESKNHMETKESFLGTIARAYIKEYSDLSEFCFVFPNKRSGTFFLKHLSDNAKERTMISPFITSITDFVEELSGHIVDSRVDMLFRLYNIYCEMRNRESNLDSDKAMLDFDSFRSWGETLLTDFSEVDQYDVEATSLFKNVTDYRDISSSFLTEEQIEVLERYFGYKPSIEGVEQFWKKLTPASDRTDLKNRFIQLWEQIGPLYTKFNEALSLDGLCTQGGAYKYALQNLRKHGKELLRWKKVVMVGFNALSTTEALIFEVLKGIAPTEGVAGDYAEFYWDGTGPVLNAEQNDAASFLKYNKRNFPSPQWAEEYLKASEVNSMPPKMRIIAAPSNSAQSKVAGQVIKEMCDEFGVGEVENAKVAVVLPDENLLMPLLYCLPENLEKVNLTMGYSLRLTSVASFIYHLRRLHSNERNVQDETAYYHEDLRLFLSHPFTHALIGSNKVSDLNGYINMRHKVMVTLPEIREVSDELADILRPIPVGTSTSAIIEYIDEVLLKIYAALSDVESGVMKTRIDRTHVTTYRDALQRLKRSVADHDIQMHVSGVFQMVDRLLSGEQVTFEGEPLEGLQVMGLLETRALDFEHLIILSLNDKIMPRKASGKTFIPDSLRHGYGLPYANYREDLFAYYFYRMISRCKSVTMIYDARNGEGMRSGGMSRYLMQLRYLYAPEQIQYDNYRYLVTGGEPKAPGVQKSPEVMAMLEKYRERGSRKNISASTLKTYCTCPVKFYYENVVGIKTDDQPSEYIDAITQGNIVHEVMLNIYFPKDKQRIYLTPGIVMTDAKIESLQRDKALIKRLVLESTNKHHYHYKGEMLHQPLEGASQMIAEQIESQIQDILEYDKRLAPFELCGGEIDGLVEWSVPEEEYKVNMRYAIDRLDRVRDESGRTQLRIVDYKTGSSKIEAKNFDAIFNGDSDASNILQLLLYANLMNMDCKTSEAVKPSIYEVTKILTEGEIPVKVGFPEVNKQGEVVLKKRIIPTHTEINEEFLERVNAILRLIFNEEEPFEPTPNKDNCKYCKIDYLCGRHKGS